MEIYRVKVTSASQLVGIDRWWTVLSFKTKEQWVRVGYMHIDDL